MSLEFLGFGFCLDLLFLLKVIHSKTYIIFDKADKQNIKSFSASKKATF